MISHQCYSTHFHVVSFQKLLYSDYSLTIESLLQWLISNKFLNLLPSSISFFIQFHHISFMFFTTLYISSRLRIRASKFIFTVHLYVLGRLPFAYHSGLRSIVPLIWCGSPRNLFCAENYFDCSSRSREIDTIETHWTGESLCIHIKDIHTYLLGEWTRALLFYPLLFPIRWTVHSSYLLFILCVMITIFGIGNSFSGTLLTTYVLNFSWEILRVLDFFFPILFSDWKNLTVVNLFRITL